MILPQLYHSEQSVRYYVAMSMRVFDAAMVAKQLTPMVREKGLTEEIARLLDENENLFEGGHDAFIAAPPASPNSPFTLAQAGALQYSSLGAESTTGERRLSFRPGGQRW